MSKKLTFRGRMVMLPFLITTDITSELPNARPHNFQRTMIDGRRGGDLAYLPSVSIATRTNVVRMRVVALRVPPKLPATFDRPPLRRR